MDFSKVRSVLFFALLSLVTISFIMLFKPFFYPIFWAAVIASIFYPLYKKIDKKTKSPRFSAGLVLVLVFFIIVIPVTAIGSLVVKESIGLYSSIDENSARIGTSLQSSLNVFQNNQYIKYLKIDDSEWIQKFSEFTKIVSAFIFNSLTEFTQNSVTFLVMFLLMFYTLYFFLIDGGRFLKLAMHLCPLGDRYEKILYDKFTFTALATMKSSLFVGAVQGFLGTLLFYFLGIEGAIIWGILMTVLCVLPIGSGFIWGPAGIVLLMTGQVWQGVVMLLFGIFVISTIDNFLRPWILGKETSMHPLLILFSTLGGIMFFGITGFIIGPIITALLVAFWEMYDDYYKRELDHN